MKQFSDIKVGDKVVLLSMSKRDGVKELVVEKIGRKYISVKIYNTLTPFDKENGYGEFGYSLFPGTLEEYQEYAECEVLTRELIKTLEKKKSIPRDKIDKIKGILNEE